MSIDLSRVTGISDSRGVITEIKDSLGRVIWAVSGGKAVLMVEKITSDTYAGETTYTGESFILLDIYPQSNGTVKVTYGGLTKTITDTSGAAEPNAQQVFFGTFNGVSDNVTTPDSGTLTIEGKFSAFGGGQFSYGSKAFNIEYYYGFISVDEWGDVKSIPAAAFAGSDKLVVSQIPGSVEEIGPGAFEGCFALNFSDNFFNEGLKSIGNGAFGLSNTDSSSLAFSVNSITIPSTVTSIGDRAFQGPTISANSVPFLKQVIVLPTTPPTGFDSSYYCFGTPSSTYPIKIIVPSGCGAAYKAATGWSSYADYIVEAL